MPTIRVRDWTKARLDKLRERQNHSSHDSVIKTLLKDHELAAVHRQAETDTSPNETAYEPPIDESKYAVPGMKVLAELGTPKDNVIFLWCPNCDTEVTHFSFSESICFEDFETTCPQCFTNLDQHALVAIEIDYPLEQKLVDDELANDLKKTVIDYWDRRLQMTTTDDFSNEDDDQVNRLVWKFDQYVKDFMWEWPRDVPVVGLEEGETYQFDDGEGRINVLERVPRGGTTIDAFRVKHRKRASGENPENELLESGDVGELLRNRKLKLSK